MTRVREFAERFAAAEAALAIAALGESDDDAYLAIEEAVRSLYDPQDSILGPLETRWAVPGGESPHANIDVSGSVKGAIVYAIAELGEDKWIAYTSSKRDLNGGRLAEALLIGEHDAELRVLGRAIIDTLSEGLNWVASGGEPVPVESPPVNAEIWREPSDPAHADLLRKLVGS